jgi:hypothetical protein
MHVLDGWARSLAGALAAGAAAWAALQLTAGIGTGVGGNLTRLVLGAVAGLGAAYAVLRMVRMKETDYVDGLIRRLFGRLRRGRAA